jgi:hypothetical protein
MLLVLLFRFILITLFTAQASQAANILSACTGACAGSTVFFPCYETVGAVATVPYRVDQGILGDLSSTTATQAVDDMLAMWETVAALDFSKQGAIGVDVDFNNFRTYLEPDEPLGYSPIIFDNEGDIVEEYFGSGSKSNVLGFASSVFHDQNPITGAILAIEESHSLYNGYLYKDVNRSDLTGAAAVLNEFKTTILHEFAHMVGVDHTQGGFIDAYNSDTADLDTFPVMFPIAANSQIELHRDDIVAINMCYPLSTSTSGKGRISGTLTKAGKNVKAGNLVVYNVANTAEEVVSTASDSDGQANGSFNFPHLVPGDYIIKAERIDTGFTGGSSVGLHSSRTGTLFSAGFYMGEGATPLTTSSLSDGIASAQRITVTAGTNQNISFELTPSVTVDPDATFTLSGPAVNTAIRTNFFKRKKVYLKIKKVDSGKRRLSLTSDQPTLVTFRPSTVTIGSGQNSVKVLVSIASYIDLLSAYSDYDNSGAEIGITVEDLDTGYIDNGSVLTLY